MDKRTTRKTDAGQPEPPFPHSGVLAVVWERDRVLLVQRRNPPQASHWGFPGGRVESGETLRTAARRELWEETGVLARPEEPFTALDMLDRDEKGVLRFHYILVAVRLTFQQGTPVAGDDALAADWFEPGALPHPLCNDVRWLVDRSREA